LQLPSYFSIEIFLYFIVFEVFIEQEAPLSRGFVVLRVSGFTLLFILCFLRFLFFSSFDPGYLVRKGSYRLEAMSSSLPFFLAGVRRLNLEHLVRHELDPVASAPGVADFFFFGFNSLYFR